MGRIACSALILAFVVISCQSPRLKPDAQNEIQPTIFTDGINFKRQNYLPVVAPTAVQMESDDGLRSLVTGTPLLFANHLFLTTTNGYLYKMRAGKLDKQSKTRLSKAISSSPTFYENILYISSLSGDHGLFAYDILKGRTIWSLKGSRSKTAPVAADGRIFHGSTDGHVVCLNARNGEIIWKNKTGDKIEQNLAFDGQNLLAVTANGAVFNLEPASGSVIWEKPLQQAVLSSPVINSGSVIVSTYNGSIYFIDIRNGKTRDSLHFDLNLYFNASGNDGQTIFIPLSNGLIKAYNRKAGTFDWQFRMNGPPSAPLLVTDNVILAGSAQKYFYIIDKNNGKLLQKIELKGRLRSLPVPFEDKLILCYEYKEISLFTKSETKQESQNE